jgi:hypothetical protein
MQLQLTPSSMFLQETGLSVFGLAGQEWQQQPLSLAHLLYENWISKKGKLDHQNCSSLFQDSGSRLLGCQTWLVENPLPLQHWWMKMNSMPTEPAPSPSVVLLPLERKLVWRGEHTRGLVGARPCTSGLDDNKVDCTFWKLCPGESG